MRTRTLRTTECPACSFDILLDIASLVETALNGGHVYCPQGCPEAISAMEILTDWETRDARAKRWARERDYCDRNPWC